MGPDPPGCEAQRKPELAMTHSLWVCIMTKTTLAKNAGLEPVKLWLAKSQGDDDCELTSPSASIPGRLTAKASWSHVAGVALTAGP